jgi:hypothetical protein
MNLLNKPFCTMCFEYLHDGHYGWDICPTCIVFELSASRRLEEWKLDSGKHFLECPCYSSVVKSVNATVSKTVY